MSGAWRDQVVAELGKKEDLNFLKVESKVFVVGVRQRVNS
jgi:flagellar biogenesis protein FliO